jgi:hypothetical protein
LYAGQAAGSRFYFIAGAIHFPFTMAYMNKLVSVIFTILVIAISPALAAAPSTSRANGPTRIT